jgi:hypothetical protein
MPKFRKSGSKSAVQIQREDETAQELVDLGRKFGGRSVGEAIVKYLDQHKDVNAVFWRRGGRTLTRKSIEPPWQ